MLTDILQGFDINNLSGANLPFEYGPLQCLILFVWYIALRLSGTLENYTRMGVSVPALLKAAWKKVSQMCGTEKDKRFIHKNLTFRCCCKKCFLHLPSNDVPDIYRKCQFYVFLIFVILLISNVFDIFRQMENDFHSLQPRKIIGLSIVKLMEKQRDL